MKLGENIPYRMKLVAVLKRKLAGKISKVAARFFDLKVPFKIFTSQPAHMESTTQHCIILRGYGTLNMAMFIKDSISWNYKN